MQHYEVGRTDPGSEKRKKKHKKQRKTKGLGLHIDRHVRGQWAWCVRSSIIK